jgi:regulator of protease activity HflC (stomatin/prohibitin superfamily)
LAVIDVSTAVILIIILIAGAIITNRIIRSRRNHVRQRENIYDDSSKQSGRSFRTPRLLSLQKNKLKILAAIITFIVIIVILSESVVIVQAGHRGVVLYVGAVENRVLGEGLHFIIPFAEQVIQLEVRTLKFQADASAASNDLQEVATVIALNYHIDPSKANIIYQQLGADYTNRIIAPTIQESVKASVAKFNAEQLVTNRETAKATIAQAISRTLSARNVLVETVFITDFRFSEAFASQIEQKVVAFQKYLTEQNNLRAVQVVANQTVVQAQAQARARMANATGEAQAINLITEQLRQSPGYLQWKAINEWNGQMPYTLSGSGGFPFLQLPTQQPQLLPKQNSQQNQTEHK